MAAGLMQAEFETNGAVYVPGALSEECLTAAQAAYDWSLDNPGPGASLIPDRNAGNFYQDLANPASFPAYDELVRHPDLVKLVSSLFSGDHAWFMYEQVFKKDGGTTRRTPWHQDTPYLPVGGTDLVVLWISFGIHSREEALEFVIGSHRGPIYDGSQFHPDDDTVPLYNDPDYPRLPDIEADRETYPIVGWATQPGDVIAFHPSILHGGGATTEHTRRETLSLRYFGDDAVIAARPGAKVANPKQNVHPLNQIRANRPGTPFRHPDFPEIY